MSQTTLELSEDIVKQLGLGSDKGSPNNEVSFDGSGSLHISYQENDTKKDFIIRNKLDSEKVDITNEKDSLMHDITDIEESTKRVRFKFYLTIGIVFAITILSMLVLAIARR